MINVDTCCRQYDCPHLNRGERDRCIIFGDCNHISHCKELAGILRERNKSNPDPNAPQRRMRSMNTGTTTLMGDVGAANTTMADIWEYVCPWCNAVSPSKAEIKSHMEHDTCKNKNKPEVE